MATKSFTTDLKFDRKSASGLIITLNSSDRKIKRSILPGVKEVKDSAVINAMFGQKIKE